MQLTSTPRAQEVFSLGEVPWTRQEMVDKLEEFSALYAKRPLKDNSGGMLSPHMFATWFLVQRLKPSVIIESGVWYEPFSKKTYRFITNFLPYLRQN